MPAAVWLLQLQAAALQLLAPWSAWHARADPRSAASGAALIHPRPAAAVLLKVHGAGASNYFELGCSKCGLQTLPLHGKFGRRRGSGLRRARWRVPLLGEGRSRHDGPGRCRCRQHPPHAHGLHRGVLRRRPCVRPPRREPARPPPPAPPPWAQSAASRWRARCVGRRIAARWVAVVGRRWAGLGLPSCVRERFERAMRV